VNNISLTAHERHQLLRVLREMDQDSPIEKRRESRRKVFHKIWIRAIQQRRCSRLRATLVNVAANGVGLEASVALLRDQRFVLPLRFQDGGGWLVLCEVRSCTATKVGYRIGARFRDRIDDPTGTSTVPMDWLM
jgi:hypothetical protein